MYYINREYFLKNSIKISQKGLDFSLLSRSTIVALKGRTTTRGLKNTSPLAAVEDLSQ